MDDDDDAGPSSTQLAGWLAGWLVVSRALCHRVMPISSKASCTTVLGCIARISQRKINGCATALRGRDRR